MNSRILKRFNWVLVLALAFGSLQFSQNAHAADPTFDVPTMTPDEIVQSIQTFGGDAADDLAKVAERVFARLGEPTAMIVGSEAQGSLIVGYRKGSGKFILPGQSPSDAQDIFWSAPSIGVNVGATASKVAVLVYGATSRDELLRRFASVEGSYHMLAGAGVSYLRSNLNFNDKSATGLAYITVGVGVDAGVAVESLHFTAKNSWL